MISTSTLPSPAPGENVDDDPLYGAHGTSLGNRKKLRYRKIVNELEKLDTIYSEFSEHRKHITHAMGQLKASRHRICQFAKEMSEPVPKLAAQKEPKNGGGGLSKPFMVSPELCHFMDVPTGTCVARAEVTKYIHQYIKNKNLYSENRQYIIPDDSLGGLLDTSNNVPVHIFDIPSKMNTHFNYASTELSKSSVGSAAADAAGDCFDTNCDSIVSDCK